MRKIVLAGVVLVIIFGAFFLYKGKHSKALKIGFVTDFEYESQNTEEKFGEAAKELLTKAVAHYNYFFKPDLVVAGGDYVSKKESSEEDFSTINSVFQKIKAEKFYCLGKKDLAYQDNFPQTYFSKIFKGINVVVLNTAENDQAETAEGTISSEQLNWLKKELQKPEPVLIFMHHSPIEIPNKDIWQQNLTNQEEVEDIFKDNDQKIIAIFSGNSRQDYITKKSGIPFINIGGLTSPMSAGRYADIQLTQNEEAPNEIVLELENYGRNNSIYKIKRDLTVSTSTRISLIERNTDYSKQKWFDLNSPNYPDGVLNSGVAGEPNLNITENGNVIAAFESKEKEGKIQVKIYKDEKWRDLADNDHPEGLISLGKGGNPNIETRGEDIFVIFTETDLENKIRLLEWQEENQKWVELSDQGFISEEAGHEPTLIFDKSQKNLYVAFAQKIREGREQTKGVVKKWNGESWETLTDSLLAFAYSRASSVDEFDLTASVLDDSIYITYEELETEDYSKVRVKKWDGLKWNNLNIDELYHKEISEIEGSSPSIAIDKEENLYLAFVENNPENEQSPIHAYKYNQKGWKVLGEVNPQQKAIEPFIEVNSENKPLLAFSEYKENIVMAKKNDKNTGEELIKTNAWRVKAQIFKNDEWQNLEDEFNPAGFFSKGSGKGDPAFKTFKNKLYLIFSDEENDYAARVKMFEE